MEQKAYSGHSSGKVDQKCLKYQLCLFSTLPNNAQHDNAQLCPYKASSRPTFCPTYIPEDYQVAINHLNIYKSLIRPNLEYCVQLWNPIPKHGNWATIMEIESVQRKFTRLIDGIGLLPYEERLSNLQLTTLIERRARGDIIEVFKIFRGLCNYGKNLFKFSRSGMKIVLTKSTSSVNTFQMRVVGYWNRIPDNVKMAENVADFKHKLEVY